VDAVMKFGGVELAGQWMVCRLGGLDQEWQDNQWANQ